MNLRNYLIGKLPIQMLRFSSLCNSNLKLELSFDKFADFKLDHAVYYMDSPLFFPAEDSRQLSGVLVQASSTASRSKSYPINGFLRGFERLPLPKAYTIGSNIKASAGRSHLFVYDAKRSFIGMVGCLQGTQNFDQVSRLFIKIKPLPEEDVGAVEIASGLNHSVMVTTDGKVYACGINTDGQLGRTGLDFSEDWVRVNIPGDDSAAKIVRCGDDFTFVLMESGRWYSWGNNEQLQLLSKSSADKEFTPQLTSLDSSYVTDIQLGSCFGIGTTVEKDGIVLWGNMGPGVNKPLHPMQYIQKKLNQSIKTVYARGMNTAFLTSYGQLFIMGANHNDMYGVSRSEIFLDTPRLLNTPGLVHNAFLFPTFMLYQI